ncbi:type II toxin-antitoxin system MqsA family antitoxin [Tatumella citrea]|nr:type II toxin-antitoxin system MqsA family antitoxin [Tatumella citrea]ARU98626.1 hypothetical protein A7K99_12935 [Tatumella citrea]
MKNCACLACGSSNVEIQSESTPFEYKGETTLIPHSFICCNDCGSETETDDHSKESKRLTIAFRKKVDGLLSGAEIKAIRNQFKINQFEAAKIFGGGEVAFSKYENDDVSQSESMDNLLIVAREIPGAFILLAKKAGVSVSPANFRTVAFYRAYRPRRKSTIAQIGNEIPVSNPRHIIDSWNTKNDITPRRESDSSLVNVMGEKVIELSYCEVRHAF